MLNADLPLAETLMMDALPVRGTLGLEEARVIAPGWPERSVLLARIARSGPGHMPMIGAREVDSHGFRLLWQWIADGKAALEAPQTVDTPSAALLAAHAIAEGRRTFDPALARHGNAEVACYFERFVPPEQRVKTLGMTFDQARLLSRPGDARRGAELLSPTGKMAACLACHIVQGMGRDFGPELTQVAARLDRGQILESIVRPSQHIAQGYEAWTLTLQDGSQHTGFLLQRRPESITLKLPTGQSQLFPAAEITAQTRLPASLMPEGLLQSLTEQEAADLLAWLAALK
jgi:putative heme-binding domain-containing protein